MTNPKETDYDFCDNALWRRGYRGNYCTCRLFPYRGEVAQYRGTYERCEDVQNSKRCPMVNYLNWDIKEFVPMNIDMFLKKK